MIRCILADDHALLRELFVKVAETSDLLRIIETFEDAQLAAERAVAAQVDVLILDVCMPGTSPFTAAKWAKVNYPALKVLFLTGSNEDEHIIQALKAGASGYVQKANGRLVFREAIQTIFAGGTYFPHIPSMRELSSVPSPHQLSPRQYEVMKLLAEGNSVKEVAMILGLSYKTVEVHKSHLYKRICVSNRTGLAVYAMRHKVVSMAS